MSSLPRNHSVFLFIIVSSTCPYFVSRGLGSYDEDTSSVETGHFRSLVNILYTSFMVRFLSSYGTHITVHSQLSNPSPTLIKDRPDRTPVFEKQVQPDKFLPF